MPNGASSCGMEKWSKMFSRFPLTMAWRESRAATGKFLFVVLSVALGTAALTAVTGFNESVRYTLLREARTLMAADISVRMPVQPSADEMRFLESLRSEGVESTRVTETVSMASSATSSNHGVPILVSVKGADFSRYPFYGRIELDPPRTRLDESSVAVSDDLLFRLKLRPGDSVGIGNSKFRIAARIVKEPDRMTTGFTLGPRVLFTREGLSSAGIIIPGSRITERVLLKLPPAKDVNVMRDTLEKVFGRRARVSDFTETNPQLTRALDRATRFLALVSLIALIVAGLGVAATMQTHLRQKMTNIAFMKCIGGGAAQINGVYVAQALLIGLAGGVVGSILGAFAQAAFARLVAGYFDIDVILIWPWAAMLKGIAAGLGTTILFTLPSLLSIAEIKPAFILRKDFDAEARPRRDRRSVVVAAIIVAGLWGIAVWVGSSVRYATVFAAVLVGSLAVLGLTGALLLRFIRTVGNHTTVRRSAALRHGIGNLHRPGAHAAAILASLGVGVMFTVTVYFLQNSLLEEVRLTAPPDTPNLFLLNITDQERDGLMQILETEKGILDRQPLSPAVQAQISTIDGVPLEQIRLEEGARRFLNTQFVLTWSRDRPAATEILEGSWWPSQPSEPLVSVQEFAAQALGLKVGSVIEWTALEGKVRARVANIRRTDAVRVGANNQFILSPGTLDKFSAVYYGALRVKADRIAAIQARIFDRFPTITAVNAADILEIIQGVMDRISRAVRFVSGFAIFGGLVILASCIVGTRYRRMREVAILKTVGATRGTLIRMFCTEFAVIGSAAGLIGGALAVIASGILIGQLLDTAYKFSWLPAFAAALITAVLTVLTGWLASYGVLNRKPLDILRNIES
jgi:putative ABC transport system permease protein